jgi:hypothetical protein
MRANLPNRNTRRVEGRMCAFGAQKMSLEREDTRKKISERGEGEKEGSGMRNA